MSAECQLTILALAGASFLGGCDRPVPLANGGGPMSDWPRAVIVGADAEAWGDVIRDDPCAAGAGEPVSVRGGQRADEAVIGTRGDYAHVDLPGGPRWVSHAPALSSRDRALVTELLHADVPDGVCASANVVFFGDPDHAIVITPRLVRAVQFSTRRVRELDALGAMLEGCRMEPGRTTYACSLDLTFGQARFDRDGVELEGSFQPLWSR